MSIVRTVVNRPTTLIIIFAMVVGFGIYTSLNLAIDLIPEINFPILVLFTGYSGAGPEQVEKTITRPLEAQLSNVSNVNEISSTSSEGSSMIMLEFTYGTNMAEAANDVRDRLEFVKDFLPDEADTPMIFKFDPSYIPILVLKVSGNRSPEDLREISENIIQSRLEQIEGVALASVQGGRERIVRVEIPQNRLEAYNLNFTQIKNILLGNNLQISAGNITEGDINYLIRTGGEYANIEEIKDTVVAYKGTASGATNPGTKTVAIRLRDIATVYEGFTDEDSEVYINGEAGVIISVQKQSGTNSVQVADNVLKRLDNINRSLPLGVELGVVFNTTEIIRASLGQVSSTAILGVILAVIILFIFLRSFKSTIIIAVAIPISLVITLMLMYFFDLTLNLMTLTGLALGLGMLVDNSIVILENIYRYREKGSKLHASAILGSNEMITAITASTLTTICVFLPVAIFRNQLDWMGEMFSGLAFTVVISLSCSLLIAILLVPVLCSKYVPLTSRRQRPLSKKLAPLDRAMAKIFEGLDEAYKKALGWVLNHKTITIITIVLIFMGSLMLISFTGFELIPAQEQDEVTVNVRLPVGTKLDITRQIIKQLEFIVKQEVGAYKDIMLNIGESSFFGALGQARTNRGSITITLPPYGQRTHSSEQIKEKLRFYFGDFPAAEFSFGQRGGRGFSANPIEITLKSEDRELAKKVALQIMDLLREYIPEATEPTLNLSEGLPQIELDINRDKAYSLGLNMHTIGEEMRANIDGITAGKYRSGGTEVDILLILDKRNRDQLPDLNKIFILSNFNKKISLASIASFKRSSGPVSISRENQSRYLRITAGLAPDANINQIVPRIQTLITQEIPYNENLVIEYGGDYEDLQEYGSTLMVIMIISVLLVFGVMASQFESFLDPFIIIFTIPLTLIGVIGIHLITGQNISLFTAVGLIMLVGIVVNNGIVLVDYTNLLRKRGLSIREACIEAGGNRLRPILMTTLTTVLGLIPVAFITGEGSSLVQPIAKTVVGGLTVSTIFTLFFIPVLYAIFNNISEKIKNRRIKRREIRRARRKKLQEESI